MISWGRTSGYSRISGITAFTITMVLFFTGIVLILFENAYELTDHFLRHQGIFLELPDNIAEDDLDDLRKNLYGLPYVNEVLFISKDEAARKLSEDLGEDFILILGFNPLPDAFEVFIKPEYFHPDSINLIKQQLSSFNLVKSVNFRENLLFQAVSNIRKLIGFLIIVVGLLLTISIILIYNTVRLAIYSRRLLFKSMLLVGATEGYIRKPFILSGIIQGLVSGLMASGILWIVLKILPQQALPDFLLLSYGLFIRVSLPITLFGMLVSTLSYFLAVKKYLRHNLEELY